MNTTLSRNIPVNVELMKILTMLEGREGNLSNLPPSTWALVSLSDSVRLGATTELDLLNMMLSCLNQTSVYFHAFTIYPFGWEDLLHIWFQYPLKVSCHISLVISILPCESLGVYVRNKIRALCHESWKLRVLRLKLLLHNHNWHVSGAQSTPGTHNGYNMSPYTSH